MCREIGGNFYISRDTLASLVAPEGKALNHFFSDRGILGTDYAYFSTGRGAQGFVLDAIKEKVSKRKLVALIPPFTCETVVEPFFSREYDLYTYPIKKDLTVDPERFEECLASTGADVVLLHRYFGFDTLEGMEALICQYQKRGVIFIEDRTQCLYSGFAVLPVDYIVGSLRKWGPLPDGGFAFCRAGSFTGKPLASDRILEQEKIKAFHLKYQYLKEGKGEKDTFLKQYQRAEGILDAQKGYFTMSPAAEKIQLGLEIEDLKQKRQDNYRMLYEALQNQDNIRILTPSLSEMDVPLYLAIQVNDRNGLQDFLIKRNIYAPIVWPKPERRFLMCQEAQNMYEQSLCLPIDQRYGIKDMCRMLEALEQWIQESG